MKTNVTKSCFHLVTYDNWIKMVFILPRQKSVAKNLIEVVLVQ